jgi:hypothetical protein
MCVASNTAAQAPQENPSDVVCERLLNEYILKRGKIESANIEAAIQLIASRGRDNGYWRVVVEHFEQSPVNDSRGSQSQLLLRILTKILQSDGWSRWVRAHPEELKSSQTGAPIRLPVSVIDTIVARAKQADRLNRDDYIIALVAAHDSRTRDFLRGILDRKKDEATKRDLFDTGEQDASVPGGPLSDGSRFYAAVGLAELGDLDGVRWLVEAPTDIGGSLFPTYVSHVDASGDLLQSRVLALADLTGQPFQTIEEAQSWWATNRPTEKEYKPKARVRLRYP